MIHRGTKPLGKINLRSHRRETTLTSLKQCIRPTSITAQEPHSLTEFNVTVIEPPATNKNAFKSTV